MKDLISDYLSNKKSDEKSLTDKENEVEFKPDAAKEEVLEEITQQFNQLEIIPNQDMSPPSSPKQIQTEVEINAVDEKLTNNLVNEGKEKAQK